MAAVIKECSLLFSEKSRFGYHIVSKTRGGGPRRPVFQNRSNSRSNSSRTVATEVGSALAATQ